MSAPLAFDWTDEGVMRPIPHHVKEADRRYCIGQRYILDEYDERSWNSHRAYFAYIRDVWMNLKEEDAQKFATPEDLRKHALIMCGYSHSRQFVLPNKKAAMQHAAILQGFGPAREYTVVNIDGCVVTELWAQSQASRGPHRMAGDKFQKSVSDVRDFLAAMIGVEPDQVERAA